MDNNNEHINLNLIIKVLSGEADIAETRNLDKWLSENKSHKQLFDEYQKIWYLSHKETVPDIENIDIDEEWKKFRKETNSDKESYSRKPQKSKLSFLRVAAVILVFISLGIAGMYLFSNKEQKIVANNEVKEAILPDNSVISINKNSELIYDKNFNKKIRKVKLKGEAFFKVAENKQKPFIVKTESFYVEVLGTQFYVNSDFKNQKVVVKKGTVAVYQYKDKRDKVILHAGDKVIFDKKENKIRKIKNSDPNYIAWKTKEFNFKDESLENIFAILENSYNIHFKFVNPRLKYCRQTVSFKNQSIEEIINVLKATFDNLNFRKKGKTIYVDGKTCK